MGIHGPQQNELGRDVYASVQLVLASIAEPQFPIRGYRRRNRSSRPVQNSLSSRTRLIMVTPVRTGAARCTIPIALLVRNRRREHRCLPSMAVPFPLLSISRVIRSPTDPRSISSPWPVVARFRIGESVPCLAFPLWRSVLGAASSLFSRTAELLLRRWRLLGFRPPPF